MVKVYHKNIEKGIEYYVDDITTKFNKFGNIEYVKLECIKEFPNTAWSMVQTVSELCIKHVDTIQKEKHCDGTYTLTIICEDPYIKKEINRPGRVVDGSNSSLITYGPNKENKQDIKTLYEIVKSSPGGKPELFDVTVKSYTQKPDYKYKTREVVVFGNSCGDKVAKIQNKLTKEEEDMCYDKVYCNRVKSMEFLGSNMEEVIINLSKSGWVSTFNESLLSV